MYLQAQLKTAPANAKTKVFKRACKANPREEMRNIHEHLLKSIMKCVISKLLSYYLKEKN